ncbi:MAG: IPT/TIG domain-containing protein, partial [Candidatus Binatia bacterium]
GYLVVMRTPKGGARIPRPGREVTPRIAGLSPGRGVPGTVVAILGEGFDPTPAKNLVTFNGVPGATIVATTGTLTAVVPGAATSGPVRVTIGGKVSNAVNFVVEPAVVQPGDGATTELVSGQTAEASLSSDGEQDRYTFTALAGSVVTVTATAQNPGVPDLVLVLEDPFGAIAAIDDNGGGGTDPRLNNFVLTATGTHTIVVTNAPGGGTGGYRVTLSIATRPAETQVSILSGDVQTGEPGTELPDPLTVFATGPTGAGLAGIPVTIVATEGEVEGQTLPGPIEAGTIVVSTNASGIVSITSQLPNKTGLFTIQIAIPGAKPVSFQVAATSGRATQVTMEGTDQHGLVDALLPAPIAVVLRTDTGTPVSGAAVEFKVVSGGGIVTPTGAHLSDAAGRVAVTWKLGKLVATPQIVAAAVPGRSRPLLFEAMPEPGAPAKLVADKTNFTRVTLGTNILNALFVRVLDAFGNPVPNTTVTYLAPGGLTVRPGVGPDGIVFPDFKTNDKGLHVAAVGVIMTAALPGSGCSDLLADIAPTIDEFGAHRLAPYPITASAPGASHTYQVDVDMGPRLTFAEGAVLDGPMGASRPLALGLQRTERFDKGSNNDFRPDPFDCFTNVPVPNQLVHLFAHRFDGNDETSVGLMPTRGQPNDATTNVTGTASFAVTLGDVPGTAVVGGIITKVHVVFTRAQNVSADFEDPSQLSTGLITVVQGPRLSVDLMDHGSGIDLKTVVATLNGTAFFDGAAPPGIPSTFPDRLEVLVGNRPLKTIDANLVRDGAFNGIHFNYFPSRPKLMASGNTLAVGPLKDRAGNVGAAPAPKTFTWP